MSDCIFCRIISRDAPAHILYEDEKTLAFLDINPSTEGHTLLVPKTHASRLEGLKEEDFIALFRALYKLVPDIQNATSSPSSTIGINNGPEAGQEVPHVHIHIIPRNSRKEGGIIQGIVRDDSRLSTPNYVCIAERIREETGWKEDHNS